MTEVTDETLAAEGTGRPGAEPAQGAIIGRYVVLSRLGAGAMGVVLAAYDPELDRKVALKLLKPRGGDQAAARARLQREAQALAKLSHQNVVAVHDVGVHEGQVFVAMEFVEGRTLGAWMKEKARPWREVVRVFEAAGRGLMAAHSQGLCHRDFKPDNVMLGEDGRVRVMDFGLARADSETPAPVDLRDLEATKLGTALTQTGSVMGTPAYMAPEQVSGLEVTARADQFSFCVAMHEALYGGRPFGGQTLAALALNVTEGRILDPPRGVSVPAWLRRVVLRGLANDPSARFAAMSEMLAALGTGEGRRRRNRAFAGIAVVGVLVGGVVGYGQYDRGQRVAACEAAGGAVDELWNAESRAALRAGLVATRVSYAPTVAEKIAPWVDKQAEAWREATTEACMNAVVHGIWNAPQLDRANWCLEERRLQLSTFVTQMAGTDDKPVRGAVQAAAAFSPVAPCVDEKSLAVLPDPPATDLRPPIAAVRARIAEARYLETSGAYEEALAVARVARARAEELAWPPLTADARTAEATALERIGAYAESEAGYIAAYIEAGSWGSWDIAASAASKLVSVVGERQARHSEGKIWAEHSSLAITYAGDPLGLREAARCNGLGNVHYPLGEYEEAKALQARAAAIWEKALGPEHPNVAVSLSNLSSVHRSLGEYAEAKALQERALAIWEQALGREHPNVAASLNNLANVHFSLDEYEAAKALYERALAIVENSLGPEHPNVPPGLVNLGNVHRELGEYQQAKEMSERALAIWEQALGPEHPNIAYALDVLGSSLAELGENDTALEHLERSVAIRSTHEVKPQLLAESRFALAKVLWEPPAGRSHARARALTEQARNTFVEIGKGQEENLAKVEAWLVEHEGANAARPRQPTGP